MDCKKTLCIVAGGSGGHILPALTLGQQWQANNNNGHILFISGSKKLDGELLKKEKSITDVYQLFIRPFPGKKVWLYSSFVIQFLISFVKSFFYLLHNRPCKVITTGGYIAIPVCLSAKLLFVPVELYELNVIPGKAIKVLAPLASKVFITFERSKLFFYGTRKKNSKFELCSYPLRFSEQDITKDKTSIITLINKSIEQENVGLRLPFTSSRKTLLILGGSQGSVFLNSMIKQWVLRNKKTLEDLQIIHQTGATDTTDWNALYQSIAIPYVVFSYTTTIEDYYVLADYVVSRGGAGVLFELEFFKKKSLIIPLTSQAADHQLVNAQEMVRRNSDLFAMCDQRDVQKDSSIFYDAVNQLIS